MKWAIPFLTGLAVVSGGGQPEEPNTELRPGMDRVGFPKGYADTFQVLRVVNKPKEHKIVTVYGNALAASVTNLQQLPYPNGSIIVMESAKMTDAGEKDPATGDPNITPRKAEVTGLHVMRREQDFGKAYGTNQAGQWEFVEYKPDGGYLTPPEKSGSCAACHVKAGAKHDFVYQGRLGAEKER